MTRSRFAPARHALKWTGLAACLVLIAAWLATLKWGMSVLYPWADLEDVHVYTGGVVVLYRGPATPPPRYQPPTQWRVGERGKDSTMVWWVTWEPPSSGLGLLIVPLWMGVVVVGLPTAWLFWSDRRRRRPGHCRCGYLLAGLADGAPCPECGTVAHP